MNLKSRPQKGNAPGKSSASPAPAETPPEKLPPLFRPIDWLTLAVAFLVVGTIYYLTLAPQVTLEDSGELCTGSYWCGIPHPPGYPFWAIYTWLWTAIVPFGNVAFRVELGEAFAATMACSLVAFMVSRGSSMLVEGIEELRALPKQWENAICMVCGLTAGLLLSMGSSMWKESVVISRISPFGVPWLTLVRSRLHDALDLLPRTSGSYLYLAHVLLRHLRDDSPNSHRRSHGAGNWHRRPRKPSSGRDLFPGQQRGLLRHSSP